MITLSVVQGRLFH